MSRDTALSKRYAKALFEVARDRGRIAQVSDDLHLVTDVILASGEFRAVLEHPGIEPEAKKRMISSLFEGKIGEETYHLLLILTDRGRGELLVPVLESFGKIADEASGEAEAIVTTPFPLSAEESEQIALQFGKITGKKIRVTGRIDTNLLGGLQVRIGDRLYDGSLSGKLDRLRKSLINTHAAGSTSANV